MNQKTLFVIMSIIGASFATSAHADGAGWAVIVFNTQNGAMGSAHGGDTRQAAEQAALDQCGAGCAGTDVATLESNAKTKTGIMRETWIQNGWVALSYGAGNAHWGTAGQHDTQANAEASANTNCGADANKCFIIRSLSSSQDGADQDGIDPAAQDTDTAPAPTN